MRAIMVVALAAVLAGATSGARAQTLDFDSVCPTPPCPASGLYAAAGVTIAPTTLNVVVANTGFLTGTNGGSYLLVGSPFQATFSLARTATFASLDVARGLFFGPGTVTFQALSNGNPVGPLQMVSVAGGNVWSHVSTSLPGGFNAIRVGSDAIFGVDNVRIAGNCAGFADVLPTDIFCNAAEWLYNRGVTLGCVLGQYCPADNVTRAQMALFMQRLGVALTPTVLYDVTGLVAVDPGTPGIIVCSKAHTPVRPSFATAVGTLVTISPNATTTYTLSFQYSTDGGATWTFWPGSPLNRATTTAGLSNSQTLATPILDLKVGTPYRFGLRAARTGGLANVVDIDCALQVTLHNFNPATAPFDVTSDALAPTSPQ